MAGTGVKRKSGKGGNNNSIKYLQCKEWIEWERAELIGALNELDKLEEWCDVRNED